jgi:hypothetical protein
LAGGDRREAPLEGKDNGQIGRPRSVGAYGQKKPRGGQQASPRIDDNC